MMITTITMSCAIVTFPLLLLLGTHVLSIEVGSAAELFLVPFVTVLIITACLAAGVGIRRFLDVRDITEAPTAKLVTDILAVVAIVGIVCAVLPNQRQTLRLTCA